MINPDSEKVRHDIKTLVDLLRPYLLINDGTKFIRLRNVPIARNIRGNPLIELTDLIDAVWDAHAGVKLRPGFIPPIDPETNREKVQQTVE